jgi:hypothetical protein
MEENEIVLFSDAIFKKSYYGDPLVQRSFTFTLPSGKIIGIHEWALHAAAKRNLRIPKENQIFVYWLSEEEANNHPAWSSQIRLAKDINTKLNQILREDIEWVNIK